MKNFEIQQGGYSGNRFIISDEGGVYRRRPTSLPNDYGLYGRLEANTPGNREKLLKILRGVRRPHAKCGGANAKQTIELVKNFNMNMQITFWKKCNDRKKKNR